MRKLLLVILLMVGLATLPPDITSHAQKKKTAAKTSKSKKKAPVIATLAECPDEGIGGDPNLNRFKNQTRAPKASAVEEWEIADVIELNGKSPMTWKVGADRKPLRDIGEGTAVAIKGYLIHAEPTGSTESCNCGLPGRENNDFHLNIVPTRAGGLKQSLVVEMSPRSRNAKWSISTLRALVRPKAYVRVTGWLMWDSQHSHFKSMPRATAWEIHPITGFEVCQGTKKECDAGKNWVTLESLE
jgi:hypothetical protein